MSAVCLHTMYIYVVKIRNMQFEHVRDEIWKLFFSFPPSYVCRKKIKKSRILAKRDKGVFLPRDFWDFNIKKPEMLKNQNFVSKIKIFGSKMLPMGVEIEKWGNLV